MTQAGPSFDFSKERESTAAAGQLQLLDARMGYAGSTRTAGEATDSYSDLHLTQATPLPSLRHLAACTSRA